MIDWNALGSFLSGAGSVLGAVWVVRRVRRVDLEECERRLDAFKEGLKLGKEE